jgi:hypothetical protein
MSTPEWNSDESEGDSRSSREIECADACLRGGPNGQRRGDVAHAPSNVTAQGTEGPSRADVSLVNLGGNDGQSANASRASGGDASGLQDDDSSGDKTDEENLPLPMAAAASVTVMEIWVDPVPLAQNLEFSTVKNLCPVTSSPLLGTVPLAAVRGGLDKSARGVKTSACCLAAPLMKGGSNFASPLD